LSARASEAAFSGGLERRLSVRQRADNDALHSGAGGNRRATGKRTDLLRRRKVALRDYGYRFFIVFIANEGGPTGKNPEQYKVVCWGCPPIKPRRLGKRN